MRSKSNNLIKWPTHQRAKATAFTLVELLVVIAIISILTPMLLSALNATERRAQRIVWKPHADDNNGMYVMNDPIRNAVGVSPNPASVTDVVTIAQLSDTHLGLAQAPDAAANLRQAVIMINARHPDAVILSGDIGESPAAWEQAETILQGLNAPVYYVPGNHDISNDTNSLALYRSQFGPDYYSFWVKNVEVLALDSELLGNYDDFNSKTPAPLSSGMQAESQNMLTWLANQAGSITGQVVIAVQHIPLFTDNDNDFPPDGLPYWTVNPPYAQSESNLLINLGVKHLLAGHWHNGRVFEQGGITIHVAPATSWLPLGGQLGFAMHTISADGNVSTEFVPLPTASGFDLVWHLNQTNFPFADSALQFPALTGVSPTPAAGIAGAGVTFNGSSTYLNAGAINLSNSFTLSAWINISPSAPNIQTIWASMPGFGTANGLAMNVNDYNTTDGALRFITGNGSSALAVTSAAGAITFGQWHLVTVTVDTTADTAHLYVDGNEVTDGANSVLASFSKTNNVILGMASDDSFQFDGTMDEARIENGTRDSNWIMASWATIAPNAMFATYGVVTPSVTLRLQVVKGKNVLSWSWTPGILQSASNVTGPYTDIIGATSPYTNTSSGTQQFFRLNIQQ